MTKNIYFVPLIDENLIGDLIVDKDFIKVVIVLYIQDQCRYGKILESIENHIIRNKNIRNGNLKYFGNKINNLKNNLDIQLTDKYKGFVQKDILEKPTIKKLFED